MSEIIQRPSAYETSIDPITRDRAVGSLATDFEIEAAKIMMTPDKLEKIERLRYASDIVIPAMKEYGDIVDEPDARKVLLQRAGMDDVAKQRKNNIEYAVQMLSTEEYGGLLVVKKNLVKKPRGKDVEQFAPLNKPGSFILIDPVNFPEYVRLRDGG